MSAPDHKTWEHAAETVLLLGAGALAAVTVLPAMGVPGWALWAIELLAGTVACFVIWAMTGNGAFSFSAFAFGAFLAAWTGWAEVVHWWHASVVTMLFGGLIVFIPWSALASRTPEPASARQPEISPAEEATRREREEIEQFEHMFSEVECDGVEVLQVEETRSGRTVRMQLPRSGKVTLTSLRGVAHRIEVILRLKDGAVEFETAAHSADIIMRLRERSAWAPKILLKREFWAHTINKPFAIGVFEDGTLAMFTLRELHALIAGTTGAGKSNLNNVIVGQLARCVDVVIWMIDMKGGRTARPWLQPWIEGKVQDPVLDWVATDRAEAELMMKAFVEAIDVRANSGIGGSKIVPSASMPQIVLICDEMADLFGQNKGRKADVGPDAATNAKFIQMAETVTQKGRSEAGASVWATQRGTVTMAGSGDLKANCKQRIALAAAQESDLRAIIPDVRHAQRLMATMASEQGLGVLAMGRKASRLAKFFYFDHPADPASETGEALCSDGCVPACPVYQTAMETGSIRPRLDRITRAGLGEIYENRWQRAGKLTSRVPAASPAATATVDIGQFEEIMTGGGIRDSEARLNPARKRMREILAARGPMGATPKRLGDQLEEEGLAVARETIQKWLRQDEADGLCHSPEFGRWKFGCRGGGRPGSAA